MPRFRRLPVASDGSAAAPYEMNRGTMGTNTVPISITAFYRLLLVAALVVVPRPHASEQQLLDTHIEQIGDAQVQTLVETGFFPDRQPVIFWHDPEWNIDLLLPASKDG